MPSFRFRRITEQTADVRIAFNISSPREIEITTVCLRFTSERMFQVLMRLRTLKGFCHNTPPHPRELFLLSKTPSSWRQSLGHVRFPVLPSLLTRPHCQFVVPHDKDHVQ